VRLGLSVAAGDCLQRGCARYGRVRGAALDLPLPWRAPGRRWSNATGPWARRRSRRAPGNHQPPSRGLLAARGSSLARCRLVAVVSRHCQRWRTSCPAAHVPPPSTCLLRAPDLAEVRLPRRAPARQFPSLSSAAPTACEQRSRQTADERKRQEAGLDGTTIG
jgi:hypothetical protein